MLAQSTFDARALHRQILELEQRAEFAQHRVEADGRDLDAALLARTDEVVVACIEGAVADAVEDGEKAALKEHLESVGSREKTPPGGRRPERTEVGDAFQQTSGRYAAYYCSISA